MLNQEIPINAWIIQSKEQVDDILLHGGKIIIMTEEIPDYLNSPQYGTSSLMATCLLPNYEAVSHYINGNNEAFIRSYNEMLCYQESVIYFVTIVSAIINNIPIGFVFGNDEIEQVAMIEFLGHFINYYGIHLGHIYPFANMPPQSGWMDKNYVANDMSLLYSNNLLTPQEFLYVYPDNIPIHQNTIQKLLIDLRPPLRNPNDITEIENYIATLRSNIKKANRVLIDPMVML